MQCRNCKRRRVTRPGKLCEPCYYQPDIRSRHVGRHICHGTREIGDKCGGYELPKRACPARPGTPEKLNVLAARARAGVSLFHPADCEPD